MGSNKVIDLNEHTVRRAVRAAMERGDVALASLMHNAWAASQAPSVSDDEAAALLALCAMAEQEIGAGDDKP